MAALVNVDGDVDRWAACGPEQTGYQADLHKWGNRMGIDTRAEPWAIIALWGDSAPSTKNDSVNLLSFQVLSGTVKKRIWICTFNKSSVCKCGCQGRHTFDDVFSVVAWSVRALISGLYPKHDHLGNEFPKGSYRRRMAGKSLGIHGTILRKFGDWAWFKQSLGLMGLARGWRKG